MYNSNEETAKLMDTIKNKNDNDIELTEEEEKFQDNAIKEIMQIAFKTKYKGVDVNDSNFLNSYRNRKERKSYTVDNIDFEKAEQFIGEILEDISASIKLASNENEEDLTIENNCSPATIMAKNMIMSLEKKDYKTFNIYVDKFEEIGNNPKYEKSKDLFDISVKSLKKIAHLGADDPKDFDQLVSGVFQTFKYPMGKNLLDTKDGKQVFGISSLKENAQNEVKQNLRNSFSKSAKKSLQNSCYFSKDKENVHGK